MKQIRIPLFAALLVVLAGCQKAPEPTQADLENSQKPSSYTPGGAPAPR